MKQFVTASTTPFDFTAVHINKNNMDGVKKDLVSPTILLVVIAQNLSFIQRITIPRPITDLSG